MLNQSMKTKPWSGTMGNFFSKFNILVLTILLGIAISFQIKNLSTRHEYVPLKVIYDNKKILDKERAEVENLKAVIQDYKNRIEEYDRVKAKDGDITKVLKSEIQRMKTLSGYTKVEGPGVIVILDDGSRQLYEGENPNNILVHDIDVLNIINDLKSAGAEAISVNGQRLLPTSEIVCSAYTVQINGQEYGQPFVIKAIGEPKHLEAAIKAPATSGYFLKEIGLFVEVNTSVNIKIPKVSEDLYFQFLKVKEGD